MASSNFVDYVKIYCRSGNGGPGSAHFRREKYLPKGGPDGGDGGKGGDIVVVGNPHKWTLLHLRYTRHLRADNGESGGAQTSTGASGKDILIEVPLGTVMRDGSTGEQLGEIVEEGQKLVLLQGGRGGQGNDHFKSSTNQAPKYAQPGEPGVEAEVVFELKVLADIGLVGFPNAGKSTLLSVLSAAKPEIADYPFTTLQPNLGIVAYRDQQSFVMADIPGIIEGASEGKGLGLRFLRHIERNSVLLFMVPADADDIEKEYEILLNELEQYNPELMHKQRLLAITKSDLLDDELMEEMKEHVPDVPYVFISSVAHRGLDQLKDMLWKALHEETE
ncbi:MAG: GTPase ObgE [Bacteroidales bacterium]|nr:GTPase ObgE [Bacteroidales bacterium]